MGPDRNGAEVVANKQNRDTQFYTLVQIGIIQKYNTNIVYKMHIVSIKTELGCSK